MCHESHGIRKQALQCESVRIVGWFLWSFRRLNSNLLAAKIKKLYNIDVTFRYATVALSGVSDKKN